MDDPLEGLLVDKQDLDRQVLSAILKEYVRIDRASGAIVLLPPFNGLGNEDKILVFLLAKKAANAVGIEGVLPTASPKEIAAGSGVKYDSVKPTVSGLFKKRILGKEAGAYFVPDYHVATVQNRLARTPEDAG